MATLNKIRAKSGVLIAIIGFALFAFVLGDLFKSGSSILRGKQNVVGVVDGYEVSYQDFNPEVQRTMEVYKNQGLNSAAQVSNIVWSNNERKILIDNEVDKLGLNIGEDELWNLIITDQSIQDAPAFKNEVGMFDENKVKEYLAYLRENSASNAQASQLWYEWINFEKSLKERGIVDSYYNLISSGVTATDIEGKNEYKFSGDQVNAKYVYIPYSSIKDEDVKVTDEEIASYVSNHADEFKSEESRDLQYVYFKIAPSLSDEAKVKEELLEDMNDKIEYNNSILDTIPGFISTDKDSLYVNAKSDVGFDAMYYHKGKLPSDIENFAFSAKVGDVFGPYTDGDTYKVSKLVSIATIPDSVKASHILISYKGAQGAAEDVVVTDEEAKVLADSLSSVLKRNSSKFSDLAKEYSNGPTSSKGGDLGWFTYGRMVPEFNNYVFNNRKGSINVVKTIFGYHVVKIEDQKNKSKAVKIATLVRNILPSEETDNDVYTKTSKFIRENKTLESFQAGAKAKGYEIRNVEGLKKMDFSISGLGDQRDIVKWAFNENTTVGTTKLQAVNDGYVAVLLYNSLEEGLVSVDEARSLVEPIIIKDKKAKLILEKLKGSTLEDIAKNIGETVREANSVHFSNPIISGAGSEPKVVGAMFGLKQKTVSEPIEGEAGVFVIEAISSKEAVSVPNYTTYSDRLLSQYTYRVSSKVFDALKSSVTITDNRYRFY